MDREAWVTLTFMSHKESDTTEATGPEHELKPVSPENRVVSRNLLSFYLLF